MTSLPCQSLKADVLTVFLPSTAPSYIHHPQLVNPLTFNVLGVNGSFREDAIAQFFNPTNTTPPFFQVFDPEFLNILGPNAKIRSVAVNPALAFAHEAPVWVPETDEVFFSSRAGNVPGVSDIDHNNRVSKINLGEVARAIEAVGPGARPVNVSVTQVWHFQVMHQCGDWSLTRVHRGAQIDLPEAVQMTNGGTGPFFGKIVLVNSGRGLIPPSLVLVDPMDPRNATVLLDNFFGRQFNSVDDAKIHPKTGNLFFTDVSCVSASPDIVEAQPGDRGVSDMASWTASAQHRCCQTKCIALTLSRAPSG